MAFTVTHIWARRGGRIDATGVRTWNDGFRVISDDPTTGPAGAILATAFSIGGVYESGSDFDFQATISNISADVVDFTGDGLVCEVTVEYSTKQPPPDQQNQNNPDDTKTVVDGGTLTVREPYDKDVNGKATVNTAGQPFVPKPERDRSLEETTYTRNEVGFDRSIIKEYVDHWNTDEFDGHAPGCALIKAIRYQRQFASGEYFYRVTYHVVFKDDDDGWKHQRILSQGTQQRVAGKLVPIYANDIPVNADQPLAANGTELPDGAPYVYVDLQPYLGTAFGPLKLTDNIP